MNATTWRYYCEAICVLLSDDKMDGFGIYNYASGDVFEGDYLAGQMCGHGEDNSSSLRADSSIMHVEIQSPDRLPLL